MCCFKPPGLLWQHKGLIQGLRGVSLTRPSRRDPCGEVTAIPEARSRPPVRVWTEKACCRDGSNLGPSTNWLWDLKKPRTTL